MVRGFVAGPGEVGVNGMGALVEVEVDGTGGSAGRFVTAVSMAKAGDTGASLVETFWFSVGWNAEGTGGTEGAPFS